MNRRQQLFALLGAGLMLPWRAQAQTERPRRIGILSIAAPYNTATAFDTELARRGWVEGRNLIVDRRFAGGDIARLPGLAGELVALRPDVIFTLAGTPGARAAKAATDRIPIVFEAVYDPVGVGFVASLTHPGGKLTGSATFTRSLDPKRMQLLAETLDKPARLAVLDMVRTAEQRTASVDPFPSLPGVTYELYEVRGSGDLEETFERMSRAGATGLVVMHSPTTAAMRADIARLALQHRLPGIADGRQFSEAGLMLTYSTDWDEVLKNGAEYVSRILAGERPADLPVAQVSHFELIINRKTAQSLGIRIPSGILALASRILE